MKKYKKRKKTIDTQARLYAILSLYAVGKENTKNSAFIRAKYFEQYGVTISANLIEGYLRNHPRCGSSKGSNGGYYIITSKSEAQAYYDSLYKDATSLFEHAQSVKTEFNL